MKRLEQWRNGLTFRQRVRWSTGCGIGFIVALLCGALLGMQFDSAGVVVVLNITLLIVMLGAQSFLYRCPHCNTRLGRMNPDAEFCPYCGKSFDEEQK